MPDQEEEKKPPLHEYLLGAIREATEDIKNGHVDQYFFLVKMAIDVKLPDKHNEIAKAIVDGEEALFLLTKHIIDTVTSKLQMESDGKTKEVNKKALTPH